jgi:hypothetical protein
MKYKIREFAQINCGLFLVIGFCLFIPPMITAQNLRPAGVPQGYSLVDGDILMPTAFVESVLNTKNVSPNTPQATFGSNVWTNGSFPFQTRGIVPFEFDTNVTAANQGAMISAMAVLENAANVHFQPCPSNICIFGFNNFVHISNSMGNNSSVGMIGGEQFINITSWGTQFIIVHELLHCLGFFHEQSRPNRNTFIQVNCGNIQGGCNGTVYNSNFQLLSALIFGTYDFDSVMHYDQCGFSIDCAAGATCACTNTVMTVLAPNQNQQTLIGQRTHLSSLDRAMVSFLYPFENWTLLDCTYNGSNGTSDGSFDRPYTTLAAAFGDTPAGGTIWVLRNCTFPTGIYSNQVTIKAAPNVTATFGN